MLECRVVRTNHQPHGASQEIFGDPCPGYPKDQGSHLRYAVGQVRSSRTSLTVSQEAGTY